MNAGTRSGDGSSVTAARRSSAISRIRGSSSAIRFGVKGRATAARRRVCVGGSVTDSHFRKFSTAVSDNFVYGGKASMRSASAAVLELGERSTANTSS